MEAEDFFGPAITITAADIEEAAEREGIEPAVIQALVQKESRSKGYLEDGRPVILYEPHKFNQFTEGKYLTKHPDLATKSQRQNKYGPSGAYQYQKLERAMALNETAALKACSWGKFQIMGFNHKICGYATVQAMVQAFVESERNQLDAFINFLRSKKLIGPMQRKDWQAIAEGYNGANYRTNNYDVDLEKIYEQLTSNIVRMGSRGTLVVTVQKLLVQHGYKLNVDGIAGKETVDAIRAFQFKEGLVQDGIAGKDTIARLAAKKVEAVQAVVDKPVTKTKQGVAATAVGTVGLGGAGTFVNQAIQNAQNSGPDIKGAAQAVRKAADSTSQVVEQKAVQDVVGTMAELSIQVQYQTYIIIALFIALMCLAGFIVWSKYEDNKRLKKAAGIVN